MPARHHSTGVRDGLVGQDFRFDVMVLIVGPFTEMVVATWQSTEFLSYDDLFKYSTATMTWTQLDSGAGVTGTGPSARSEHTMTAAGQDLYVFGGLCVSGESGGVEGNESLRTPSERRG